MPNLTRIRLAGCLALGALGTALAALGTAPAGAQQPGAPAPPSGPGRATAELVSCHVAVDQAARYATFAGDMTTIPGADRLAMRVDLLQRGPGSAFRGVSAPTLGVWHRSAAGVAALRYVKQVTNLPAPAAFRTLITFRWLDASGKVIRQAARRSPVCVQPDERPRLEVSGVDTSAAGQSSARYRVTLFNGGRGPAGAFGVVVNVNGQDQPPLTVAALDAGGRAVVEQVAPRCTPGSTITVTPDPGHQVDEAAGGGLARTVSCPLGATSARR